MKRLNLKSYSILTAFKMPEADGRPPVPIAAGKLARVIKFALDVSPADYYGLSINYGGGILGEKDIEAIVSRTDFPK